MPIPIMARIQTYLTDRANFPRKFQRDVVWNLASLAVLAVSGVLLNVVIAWFYDPAVLGIFNQVYAFYMVFSQFAVAGVHLSVLKHTAQHADDPPAHRVVFTTGLVLSSGFALMAGVLFYASRGIFSTWTDSPGVMLGVQLATPGLFFFSLNKVTLSMLNGLGRMRRFAVFQALRSILMITSLIILSVLDFPGEVLALIFTISEGLLFILLLPQMLPELYLASRQSFFTWLSTHLSFGIRGFFSNVLLQLNTRVDVLILGYFASDEVVGLYSFAAMIVEGISLLPTVLQNNYNPLLVQLIAAKKWEELRAMVQKGKRFTYAAMTIIGVLCIFLYPLGLMVATNKGDLVLSWEVFSILMGGLILSAGYSPFGSMLLQAGRPGLHTIMVFLLVTANALGNFLLVPLMGAIGSATATACTFVLSVLLLRIFTRNVLQISI